MSETIDQQPSTLGQPPSDTRRTPSIDIRRPDEDVAVDSIVEPPAGLSPEQVTWAVGGLGANPDLLVATRNGRRPALITGDANSSSLETPSDLRRRSRLPGALPDGDGSEGSEGPSNPALASGEGRGLSADTGSLAPPRGHSRSGSETSLQIGTAPQGNGSEDGRGAGPLTTETVPPVDTPDDDDEIEEIERPPPGFYSKKSFGSLALVLLYTGENVAGGYLQRTNPAALLPVLFNLTGYLPQLIAQALSARKYNKAMTLETTMWTKIIGAGLVEGLQILSEREPQEIGLGASNTTAHANMTSPANMTSAGNMTSGAMHQAEPSAAVAGLTIAGFVFAIAIISDLIGRLLRNATSKGGYVLPVGNRPGRDFRNENHYFSSFDHAGTAISRTPDRRALDDLGRTLAATGAKFDFDRLPDFSNRIEDIYAATLDVQEYDQEDAERRVAAARPPPRFAGKKTNTSGGLLVVFIGLNVVGTVLQDGNPGAQIPPLFNLLGYLPQLVGKTIDKFKHKEPLVLDATLITKIIGGLVLQGLGVGLEKAPKAMGVDDAGSVGAVAAVVGYAFLAAVVTDFATREINRRSDLHYVNPLPGNSDPRRDLQNDDHFLHSIDQGITALRRRSAEPDAPVNLGDQALRRVLGEEGFVLDDAAIERFRKDFDVILRLALERRRTQQAV